MAVIPTWQCPKCPRQILMNWDGWEFARNIHEKSHNLHPSGSKRGRGGETDSGGGILDAIGDLLGSVIDSITD